MRQEPPVALLLAAGTATRFGAPKLLAPLPGADPPCSVAAAACANLLAARLGVVAVLRPADEPLAAVLAQMGARIVRCADAHRGMGASLACGVRAAPAAKGWVVALADMPWIRPATIAEVAAAVGAGASVAAPYCDGVRGHPVGFGAACGAELATLATDEGARTVVAAHADALVRIDVADPGILRDVDRPDDLRPE